MILGKVRRMGLGVGQGNGRLASHPFQMHTMDRWGIGFCLQIRLCDIAISPVAPITPISIFPRQGDLCVAYQIRPTTSPNYPHLNPLPGWERRQEKRR